MLIHGHDFPDDIRVQVEHQVWARPEADGSVRVGITSVGIALAGEIYMARPRSVGSVVEAGRSIAVVELAKSIVSVKSPIAGRVVEVNTALEDHPERVQRSPYGDGWLARLEPTALEPDWDRLLHGEALRAAVEHHLWLHRREAS